MEGFYPLLCYNLFLGISSTTIFKRMWMKFWCEVHWWLRAIPVKPNAFQDAVCSAVKFCSDVSTENVPKGSVKSVFLRERELVPGSC